MKLCDVESVQTSPAHAVKYANLQENIQEDVGQDRQQQGSHVLPPTTRDCKIVQIVNRDGTKETRLKPTKSRTEVPWLKVKTKLNSWRGVDSQTPKARSIATIQRHRQDHCGGTCQCFHIDVKTPWEYIHSGHVALPEVLPKVHRHPEQLYEPSEVNTRQVDGLARIPGLTQAPYKSHPQPPNSVPRSPTTLRQKSSWPNLN